MITYIWKINLLEKTIPDGGVIVAHWDCVATDENGVTARNYGSEHFSPDPESPDFIPYEDLTEEIVLNWIKPKIAEDDITLQERVESNLQKRINNIVNPSKESGLPW